MKILLIAGHGAGDPGATGLYKDKKILESDETRNLSSLISSELLKNGISVDFYPFTRNAYSDYQTNISTLKNYLRKDKYDYVLELHMNAIAQSKFDKKTKGVECYVTTSEKGTLVEEKICKAISNFGFANRGVKRKNYSVINCAKKLGISSALLETCFIDDPDDMEIYLNKKNEIAKAVAIAICEGFGIKLKEDTMDNLGCSDWAYDACKWCIENRIIIGDSSKNYRFKESVSREEMAIMLKRMYDILNKR